MNKITNDVCDENKIKTYAYFILRSLWLIVKVDAYVVKQVNQEHESDSRLERILIFQVLRLFLEKANYILAGSIERICAII
jgi:hypothetical protein